MVKISPFVVQIFVASMRPFLQLGRLVNLLLSINIAVSHSTGRQLYQNWSIN